MDQNSKEFSLAGVSFKKRFPISNATAWLRLRTACAVALLLFLALPALVQAQYTYTTNNNSITITKYTGSGGEVTIPDTINGLPVTSIGGGAFSYCTNLTSVTIPASVTSIGPVAFTNCTNLVAITVDELNSVYSSGGGVLFNKNQARLIQYPASKPGSYYRLPPSVTSIEDYSFAYCISIASLGIPNSVTTIGFWAFAFSTSLTNVLIPNSVTTIAANAFDSCTRLASVTIPNSVTNIGDRAFVYCTGLASVTNGTGVANIADLAFAWCTNLTGIYFQGNAPSVGLDVFNSDSHAIIYYLAGTTGWGTSFAGRPTMLWPQAIFNYGTNNHGGITIGQYTGTGGPVIIPNTIDGLPVTSIAQSAFHWSSMTSVTIPASVTSIGPRAFGQCTNMTAITVDAQNPAYSSVDGVLFNKSQTTLMQYPGGKAGSYVIPNSVTSIAPYAFYVSPGLTRVTIPNSVTSIGDNAFYYCPSLTSVTIGNGVKNIGEYAFANCANLTAVYFKGNAYGPVDFLYQIGFSQNAFVGDPATVYYLPGTTGWGATCGGCPTALWNLPVPRQVQADDASFGVRTNGFGFTLTGTSGQVIVVDACTNLVNPTWFPLQTNTLTSDSFYFNDPEWTNYPGRFYRLRSP